MEVDLSRLCERLEVTEKKPQSMLRLLTKITMGDGIFIESITQNEEQDCLGKTNVPS